MAEAVAEAEVVVEWKQPHAQQRLRLALWLVAPPHVRAHALLCRMHIAVHAHTLRHPTPQHHYCSQLWWAQRQRLRQRQVQVQRQQQRRRRRKKRQRQVEEAESEQQMVVVVVQRWRRRHQRQNQPISLNAVQRSLRRLWAVKAVAVQRRMKRRWRQR